MEDIQVVHKKAQDIAFQLNASLQRLESGEEPNSLILQGQISVGLSNLNKYIDSMNQYVRLIPSQTERDNWKMYDMKDEKN